MASGGNINMGGCAIIGVLILVAIGSCLPKNENAGAQGKLKFVTARSLNCRADAAIDADVITNFRRDEAVTIVEERGEWSRLETTSTCWVAARYLADAPGPDGIANEAAGAGGAAALLAAPPANGSPSRTSGYGGGSGGSGVGSMSDHGSGYDVSRGRASVSGKSSLSRGKKASARKKAPGWKKKRSAKRGKKRSGGGVSSGYCPCSGYNVCIGPRGGRYCITSGGNKRYGV